MMSPFFASFPLAFIGDADDQFAHVSYVVDLLFPLEAVQVNLSSDALKLLLGSVDIGDADAVMQRRKSPFSAHLNGVNLCVGKSVPSPVSGLKAELSARENPVEPLVVGR